MAPNDPPGSVLFANSIVLGPVPSCHTAYTLEPDVDTCGSWEFATPLSSVITDPNVVPLSALFLNKILLLPLVLSFHTKYTEEPETANRGCCESPVLSDMLICESRSKDSAKALLTVELSKRIDRNTAAIPPGFIRIKYVKNIQINDLNLSISISERSPRIQDTLHESRTRSFLSV